MGYDVSLILDAREKEKNSYRWELNSMPDGDFPSERFLMLAELNPESKYFDGWEFSIVDTGDNVDKAYVYTSGSTSQVGLVTSIDGISIDVDVWGETATPEFNGFVTAVESAGYTTSPYRDAGSILVIGDSKGNIQYYQNSNETWNPVQDNVLTDKNQQVNL